MPERTALVTALLALAVCLLTLGGCSSAGKSSKAASAGAGADSLAKATDSVAKGTADGGVAAASAPQQAAPKGPAIVVTWEALAREIYLQENSRFRRRGPQAPQKITLISSSHPNAAALAAGHNRRGSTSSTAILSDRDMVLFVRGLERSGFFKYARPAGYDSVVAQSDDARGRVTVTRGGESRTLLSMRGQGRNERTKAIPALYSESKKAIMALRNMTPTLSVSRSSASGTARTR